MSKGNMLLGFARGKVGSLVFSRANGQQITRARAEVIKNPQTESQMIQRIILNTISQAYSRMREITDHSFEGVQAGQKSMSMFMTKNIQALRQMVAIAVATAGEDLSTVYAFTPIGQNTLAPNAYIISSGSLPEIATTFPTSATTPAITVNENTYQGVCDALGLQQGDQLTFVTLDGLFPNLSFHYTRVILSPMNADGTDADMSMPFISNGAINLPNERNEGEFNTLTYADGKISFRLTAKDVNLAGVIASRKGSDGNWMRSNCTLTESSSTSSAYSMQDCLDLFESGGIDTLSSRYLNNAGTGALATSGNNSYVTSINGNAVTLVSVALEEVSGVGNRVMATDTSGNKYYVINGDEHIDAYGRALSALSYTAAGAKVWIATAGTTTANSFPVVSGETSADWLISQGVSYTVFNDTEGSAS